MHFDCPVQDIKEDLKAEFQPIIDQLNRSGNNNKTKLGKLFEVISVEEVKLFVDCVAKMVQMNSKVISIFDLN